MTNDTLSVAVSSLQAEQQALLGLGPLPPAADGLKNQINVDLEHVIGVAEAIQAEVGEYVQVVRPLLSSLQTKLADSGPGGLQSGMDACTARTSALQQSVGHLSSSLQAAADDATATVGQLAEVQASLNAQSAALQASAASAEQVCEEAENRYRWLKEIGALGSVIAEALEYLTRWQDELARDESQLLQIAARGAVVAAMSASCGRLVSAASATVDTTTGIRNEIGFIAGDAATISSDLQLGRSAAVLTLALSVAQTQVQTLAGDAG